MRESVRSLLKVIMKEVDRDVMVWPADAAEQSCTTVSTDTNNRLVWIMRKAACGKRRLDSGDITHVEASILEVCIMLSDD